MSDLTVIYYTANKISDYFFQNTKRQLLLAADGLPTVSVSQKPIDLGRNICVGDIGYNSLNIYKQALIGAKLADTEYIALAEDDVLYSPDHFRSFPESDRFIYNNNLAKLYTWSPQGFVFRNNHGAFLSLICKKDLFIKAMEERFAKYPGATDKPDNWTEPGWELYEKRLGVTNYGRIEWTTKVSNIVFLSPQMLGFGHLGFRKKLGEDRRSELPYWGKAKELIKLYKDA